MKKKTVEIIYKCQKYKPIPDYINERHLWHRNLNVMPNFPVK